MKRLMVLLITALVTVVFLAPGTALAQRGTLLGERHVNDRTETDTIQVGKEKGSFTGFRIRATGAPVEFKRIVIHFENGSEQVFERNRLVRKGDGTRVIDLAGGARFIDRVVFVYEARSRGWRGAHVKLFGVH
jgi:hypothetical protein